MIHKTLTGPKHERDNIKTRGYYLFLFFQHTLFRLLVANFIGVLFIYKQYMSSNLFKLSVTSVYWQLLSVFLKLIAQILQINTV